MAMQKPPAKYIREGDVTARLQCHRSTLWRWVKEGRFPEPRDMGGGVKWWHVDDLEAWEAELR